MNRKKVAVLSLSAAALLVMGGGNAHAEEGPKYQNNTQVLSCLNLEVLDIPILSTANNNIDCSTNREVAQREHVASETQS